MYGQGIESNEIEMNKLRDEENLVEN